MSQVLHGIYTNKVSVVHLNVVLHLYVLSLAACRRPLAQPATGLMWWPFVEQLTVGSDPAGAWAVPAHGLLPLSFRHSLFCLLWALLPEPCGACSIQGPQGT